MEPGDLDRIVVVNKKTARVYLRPGARGVPLSNRNRSSSATAGITSSRNMSKRTPGEKDWEGDTVMDMGSSQDDIDDTSSTTMGGLMSLTQRGSVVDGSRLGGGGPQPLVYHFTIGSVESLEEKMA